MHADNPRIEPALLCRYDLAGPRYTSYPTAPQFQEGFREADLRQAILASNGDPIPRRLSVYVHVPFCTNPCFYCGCNRVITRDKSRAEAFLSHLHGEIELAAPLFDRDREVVQLHFGGGTPNFLRSSQLQRARDMLRRHFRLAPSADLDFSIELDPRAIDTGEIEELSAMGFNRASLGVQDFDPAVQEAVNRLQSVAQTRAIVDACRLHRFRSVNIDLIYGLPRQNITGFERTLREVVAMRPDRIAVYSYAHLPHLVKAQRQIEATDLPDPATKQALLQLAIERLGDAGYVYIGMDHFALPDDDLAQAQRRGGLHRNFMGYTTHADSDLIGFGPSAISHVGDTYSQNERDVATWQKRIDAGHLPVFRGLRLATDDQLRADVIQSLMCHGEVPVAALERRYDIDFDAYFADAIARLQPLQADGLVLLEPGRVAVTSTGRLLLRIVAMCFDRYLGQTATVSPVAATRGFARAV